MTVLTYSIKMGLLSRWVGVLCFCILVAMTLVRAQWASQWVSYDAQGKLKYKADAKGNTIPDFSRVGYKEGKTPPTIAVAVTLSPATGDNYQRIQAALDRVGKMPLNAKGFRGAVLLKKGLYQISTGLLINQSGVVLRGEGDGTNGTVILFTAKKQGTGITIKGGNNKREVVGTRVKITDAYVPVGSKTLTIESASQYTKGDDITIYRPGTTKWINDLKMNKIPPKKNGGLITQWKANKYDVSFERKVEGVSGNTLTIDQPVVMAMETGYGGGFVYKYTQTKKISNCGVEGLLIQSTFDSSIVKTIKKAGVTESYFADEKHGWIGVLVGTSKHSWVRSVTVQYFGYSSITVSGKYISILNCKSLDPVSQIDGGRRYAFNLTGQMCLFSKCFSDKARHAFILAAKIGGPNVFTRSTSTNSYSDIGPHQRWAMGTLFDVIEDTSGQINVQDRSNSGSGHGWAGVNQVLWNCSAKEMIVQSPWVTGSNYAIGCRGEKMGGSLNPIAPDGVWEGLGETNLEIESLYEAQLKDRGITTTKLREQAFKGIRLRGRELILNDLKLSGSVTLRLFNVEGKELYSFSLQDEKSILLKDLESGLYFIQVEQEKRSFSQKIFLR